MQAPFLLRHGAPGWAILAIESPCSLDKGGMAHLKGIEVEILLAARAKRQSAGHHRVDPDFRRGRVECADILYPIRVKLSGRSPRSKVCCTERR